VIVVVEVTVEVVIVIPVFNFYDIGPVPANTSKLNDNWYRETQRPW